MSNNLGRCPLHLKTIKWGHFWANPKNDCHCLSITTQSGKVSINQPMPVVDDKKTKPMIIDGVDDNEVEDLMVNKDVFQWILVAKKWAKY